MIKTVLRNVVPVALRRWLQRRKLDALLAAFPRRVVCHRYAGELLQVELADSLAEGWYDHDWDQLPELDVLACGSFRPGARVFDLGAHQGIVGMILARRVGPTGQVVLVEANPRNVAMCRRNAELNKLPWVMPHHAAVGDRNGVMSFNSGWIGQAGELSDYAGLITVPAVTIDALTERYGRPDIVLMDVEGYECKALTGAVQTLRQKVDWSVEVHLGYGLEKAGGSAELVLACFPTAEFELYVHSDGDTFAVPLESAPPTILRSRFFLTAICRTGVGH